MAEDEKGAEGAEAKEKDEAGLVAKNKELLGELKALKAKIKDVDLDAAKEALEFKAHAEEELATRRGEFEKLRLADKEKAQRELAKRDAREAKLTKALHERLVDHELSKAIRKAGGDPEYVLDKGRGRVEVVETDDGWETVVKGPDGKVSDMDALALELREKYPRAFDGIGSSGSGASAGGGGGVVLPDPNDPKAVGAAADAWLRARSTKQA